MCEPTPMISTPRSLISPTTAQTFDVPMSRPTTMLFRLPMLRSSSPSALSHARDHLITKAQIQHRQATFAPLPERKHAPEPLELVVPVAASHRDRHAVADRIDDESLARQKANLGERERLLADEIVQPERFLDALARGERGGILQVLRLQAGEQRQIGPLAGLDRLEDESRAVDVVELAERRDRPRLALFHLDDDAARKLAAHEHLLHPRMARDFFLDLLRIDAPDAHAVAQTGGRDDLAAADFVARGHLDLAHRENLVVEKARAHAPGGADRAFPVDRDE